MSVRATYYVTGMNCGHCVRAVTEELTAITGVTSVAVDLHADGPSAVHVTSDVPLAMGTVAAAIDEAGYVVSGAA